VESPVLTRFLIPLFSTENKPRQQPLSLCIIFNPAARGEKALKFRSHVEQMKGDWILKPTTGPGAARRLAAEAIAEGHKTLVAAGGDGTLNEVLNGIGDAPDGFERVRLGVIPLGTINVFARELKLPLEPRKIWPILESGKESRIDLGLARFQNEGRSEARYFIQLAGAGWDARAVELVNWELKKKIGSVAYVVAGLNALTLPRAQIEISNGSQKESGELIILGNGKLYGGNFPILHQGDLQDGLLDAVVFRKVNWLALPGHLWDWLTGKMYQPGGSIYLRGAEFSLTSETRAVLQLDGELAGQLPATLSVLPQKLRVLTP
jgi:YegS/Rv2252/BmrU family lipid kinase